MKQFIYATACALAAGGIAVAVAPVAGAVPECIQTTPTTTQCSTNGSTAITTSPPLNNWSNYGPLFWGGWGGGIVIGVG